jgi:antitoxin FitA
MPGQKVAGQRRIGFTDLLTRLVESGRRESNPHDQLGRLVTHSVPDRAGPIAFQQQQLHNDAMSTSITVRDVPDQTRDELASRAALTGRSLQEYLRAKLVELAGQPDAEVLIARVRARKAASASSLPRDRILAHRDEDRR